jgi:hypothetical protein
MFGEEPPKASSTMLGLGYEFLVPRSMQSRNFQLFLPSLPSLGITKTEHLDEISNVIKLASWYTKWWLTEDSEAWLEQLLKEQEWKANAE